MHEVSFIDWLRVVQEIDQANFERKGPFVIQNDLN